MLTDPDIAYLRRLSDKDLLPADDRHRLGIIASDISLFLTRVEDAIWVIDHDVTPPERRLADVRELLSECTVAEDTRVESGPEDGTPPSVNRMQALAAFQVGVARCTLGLDGDDLAAVLSQALQHAEITAHKRRFHRE